MITILGPTACGKTQLAVALAAELSAEIISADSRQVYRGMDIGTGKDLDDYVCQGEKGGSPERIPCHLIDICEPGEKYNVYRYQHDFAEAYTDITRRGKGVVLCGGTGLYIEAVLRQYRLPTVPQNAALRAELDALSLQELTVMLQTLKAQTGHELHNTTDVDTKQRAIRAIEIEKYLLAHPEDGASAAGTAMSFPEESVVVGIEISRERRRERISQRLHQRLEEGMVDEVRHLLETCCTPEQLIYYGLEYKYITLYLTGQLAYQEMVQRLEIAIHQFAKRQMTWFRGMERRGVPIHWIDFEEDLNDKLKNICQLLPSLRPIR